MAFISAYHDFFPLVLGLEEMAGESEYAQTKHKEESAARIISDGEDRLLIRQKIAICIHPLKPEEHKSPEHLINVDSGEVAMNPAINVDNAPSIGKEHMNEFMDKWPGGFYEPLKRKVVLMSAERKCIDVDGQ